VDLSANSRSVIVKLRAPSPGRPNGTLQLLGDWSHILHKPPAISERLVVNVE
jgi:hypothetical protein